VGDAQFKSQMNSEKSNLNLTGNLEYDLIQLAGFSSSMSDSLNKGTNIGTYKSPIRAALFSMAVPGAGEFYSKQYVKGALFLATEIGLWIAYAAYTNLGDNKNDEFQQYADKYFSVVRYVNWIAKRAGDLNINVADTTGVIIGGSIGNLLYVSNPWDYVDWNKLNKLEDKVAKAGYNGFTHHLPKRPEQQYYELIGKYCQYIGGWADNENAVASDVVQQKVSKMFNDYSIMRGKANDYYYIASTAASILVANHILSALDAAWSAARHNWKLKLSAHLKPTERTFGFVEFVPTASVKLEF
jgi:TM2 domain-containing membrane protein YozV